MNHFLFLLENMSRLSKALKGVKKEYNPCGVVVGGKGDNDGYLEEVVEELELGSILHCCCLWSDGGISKKEWRMRNKWG